MKRQFGKRSVLFGAMFLLLIWAVAASATGRTPRHPADESRVPYVADEDSVSVLVLKLHEGTRARLKSQEFVVKERGLEDLEYLSAVGLTPEIVDVELPVLQGLILGHRAVLQMRPLFEQTEAELELLKINGEQQSGKQLADLNLYFGIDLVDGMIAANLRQFVDDLNANPSVEIAYFSPRSTVPVDPTPALESEQTYLDAAPTGIDARYAWTLAGGRGEGVRIVDVEFNWIEGHEDLPPFFYRGGGISSTPCNRDHGTAVLGEFGGRANAFGVTGISSSAEIGVQSILRTSFCNAFSPAGPAILAAALEGDIVVVELQVTGPRGGEAYAPEEYVPDAFDAIQTATAQGVVVVEPAGNGSGDLDNQEDFGRL